MTMYGGDKRGLKSAKRWRVQGVDVRVEMKAKGV
jgi:hypothetical protein